MIATSAEICNRDISNEEILTRVEHKLDHIIEILEDKTLTLEEETHQRNRYFYSGKKIR